MRQSLTPEEILYYVVKALLCGFIILCVGILLSGSSDQGRMMEAVFILGAMLNGLVGVRLWDEARLTSQILIVSAFACFALAFI